MTSLSEISALALFSGGLDSILASRLVMSQGIRVVALRFVSPFFGWELLAREEDYRRDTSERYGIDVHLRDVSPGYLKMLRNPAHGYGKNFNPCVDCKIMLMSEARRLMGEFNASFLISGEVIGQRPMSQRRDTLRIIERESGCEGLLVRPLCAGNLEVTRAEAEGLVDRQRLLAFSGRSRQPQMELAEEFGIDDYPSPAGGCVLTDPILGARIKRYYQLCPEVSPRDIQLLLLGRQFHLPGGGWLTLGRNKGENERLLGLMTAGDLHLELDGWPGPDGLLRRPGGNEDMELAGALVKYFSRKGEGRAEAGVVIGPGSENLTLSPVELSPAQVDSLRL